MKPNYSTGFSLVELSIVLVILGLLVGGILAGQSLIRASELRSVGAEYTKFKTAGAAFRDKYFALPGDMVNATSFWGIAAGSTGNDTTCQDQASTDTKTCNGNGDGQIVGSASDMTYAYESYRLWQQLTNAGLLEGQFTGRRINSNQYSTGPENAPASKMNGGQWSAWNWGASWTGSSSFFNTKYGNAVDFGALNLNNDPGDKPLLTPTELWNIDTKLDDGRPGRGTVIARRIDLCTDAPDKNALDANYLLANTGPSCTIVFKNVF